MKLIGKNSLLYWLRIPFAIYVIGFLAVSLWIFVLMIAFALTNETNQFTSIDTWENSKTEIVQFHYPLTKMVLATENSLEGKAVAFVGLLSICCLLYITMKIVFLFSRENIFTEKAVKLFSLLGFGMIVFGICHLIFDLIDNSKRFDFTPPFFLVLIGTVILLMKEIFTKGRNLQEENDLTI